MSAVGSGSARVLEAAYEALSGRNEVRASNMIVGYMDDLFIAGDFAEARCLLAAADAERITPKVLSALLMVSRTAKEELGKDRTDFIARARVALSGKWKLSEDRVESIMRRHA